MENNLYNQKHRNQTKKGNLSAKRVNIISVKMVKECSLMYKDRVVGSPKDGFNLLRQFQGDVDREHFVVVCIAMKNQPIKKQGEKYRSFFTLKKDLCEV